MGSEFAETLETMVNHTALKPANIANSNGMVAITGGQA